MRLRLAAPAALLAALAVLAGCDAAAPDAALANSRAFDRPAFDGPAIAGPLAIAHAASGATPAARRAFADGDSERDGYRTIDLADLGDADHHQRFDVTLPRGTVRRGERPAAVYVWTVSDRAQAFAGPFRLVPRHANGRQYTGTVAVPSGWGLSAVHVQYDQRTRGRRGEGRPGGQPFVCVSTEPAGDLAPRETVAGEGTYGPDRGAPSGASCGIQDSLRHPGQRDRW